MLEIPVLCKSLHSIPLSNLILLLDRKVQFIRTKHTGKFVCLFWSVKEKNAHDTNYKFWCEWLPSTLSKDQPVKRQHLWIWRVLIKNLILYRVSLKNIFYLSNYCRLNEYEEIIVRNSLANTIYDIPPMESRKKRFFSHFTL